MPLKFLAVYLPLITSPFPMVNLNGLPRSLDESNCFPFDRVPKFKKEKNNLKSLMSKGICGVDVLSKFCVSSQWNNLWAPAG